MTYENLKYQHELFIKISSVLCTALKATTGQFKPVQQIISHI